VKDSVESKPVQIRPEEQDFETRYKVVRDLTKAARLIEAAAYDLACENPPNFVVSLLQLSRSIEVVTSDLIESGYPASN
jgi:hypothetical protein